jgi:hypothetical protein
MAAMLVTSACGSEAIQPPPSSIGPRTRPWPSWLPPSYVAAPVVFDLRPVLAQIEAVVPKKFGSTDKEKRIQVMKAPECLVAPDSPGPFQFGFKTTTSRLPRSRSIEQGLGQGVALTHSVTVAPTGKPKPRIRVVLSVTYDLTPDWRLKTKTKCSSWPGEPEERDHAKSRRPVSTSPRRLRMPPRARWGRHW